MDGGRIAPWASELPETLTAEQGRQLAIDRIAWREAGRPDPAEADQWADDQQLDFLLDRPSPDTLDLSGLKLRDVPEELYRTEGLKFLFLADNRIETIPDRFVRTLQLESLSLFANPLREVPAELLLMEGLAYLYLGRSALVALPQLDRPNPHMRSLGLERTEWLEIPDGYLAHFPQLRSLLLGHSFRSRIPQDVFSLPELAQLDCEGNPLRRLPPDIGKLRRLVSLNLKDCQLETLPSALGGLTLLGDKAGAGPFGLHIAGNPFKDKDLKRIAKLKNPLMTKEALAWARDNGT